MVAHPFISIASGIGMLDLGVERGSGGNAKPVCYIEREVQAASVLAARMEQGDLPQAPIWSDLKTFDPEPWIGKVDGIIGGYPCQPFTVSGTLKMHDDPRNIWHHIYETAEAIKPAWMFFENVVSHLNFGYKRVKRDIESLSYRCSEQVLSAYNTTRPRAPHIRERLFILAVDDTNTYFKLQGAVSENGEGVYISNRPSRPSVPNGGYPYGRTQLEEWLSAPASIFPFAESKLPGELARDPKGMGIGRIDQCALIGNSVVPQCAEFAWTLLWDDFFRERDLRVGD